MEVIIFNMGGRGNMTPTGFNDYKFETILTLINKFKIIMPIKKLNSRGYPHIADKPNEIYVTVLLIDNKYEISHISFYNETREQTHSIDFAPHDGMNPHVHD
jgi:hypothetical protein